MANGKWQISKSANHSGEGVLWVYVGSLDGGHCATGDLVGPAGGFRVVTAQPTFGTSNGQIDQQANVAGDAQPARVRDAVPIEDQQVRRDSELLESIQHRGRFAEAEQAGHVGEVDGAFGDGVFEDVEVGVVEHHHGCARDAFAVAGVDAGDGGDGIEGGLADDAWGQFTLQRDGSGWIEIPGMGLFWVYGYVQHELRDFLR